ncbi:hypothetical protein [Porphyromonas sp. KLE 1280]|uniref:hypothetical protein n=1 Tax=Porphyromonas sp. KLE 1280 TaxID=997829 RepID=UPI001E3DAF1D|nr:hypothetical protein [Porphyromonas sp. KLE 1280]
MSKHVLGLDLGVGSIGWCLIALDAQGDPAEILGMGSRVVPLNNATKAIEAFNAGAAFTASQERTARRTMRRGFARYQLRRYRLRRELEKVGMLPDAALIQLPLLELWELRERASTAGGRLTLPELGRVLCHINQKRGYRHVKSDAAAIVGDEGEKKKDSNSAYLAGIRANDEKLQDEHKTVGSTSPSSSVRIRVRAPRAVSATASRIRSSPVSATSMSTIRSWQLSACTIPISLQTHSSGCYAMKSSSCSAR